MKNYLLTILAVISFITVKAERVKGKTIGYSAIGGEAVIELSDSARVFPYEPVYGEWRLVMWVGYVDTSFIKNRTTIKAESICLDEIDFSEKAKLLKEAKVYTEHGLYNLMEDKKVVVVYAYIPEKSIRNESRMEPRLEQVLKIRRKKKQKKAFEIFKKDFGFVGGTLIQDSVNLHFVYDKRSPLAANDYRLVIFTNAKDRIIAVAHEGYRKLKLKSKSKLSLDRKLTIYFIRKTNKAEQLRIKQRFIESFQFRNY